MPQFMIAPTDSACRMDDFAAQCPSIAGVKILSVSRFYAVIEADAAMLPALQQQLGSQYVIQPNSDLTY